MAFSDDNSGFSFTCDDAKMEISCSTWKTRLSQIGRVKGSIYVMTDNLPDTDYISEIISKRPQNFFIIANSSAITSANHLKIQFPDIKIALHPKNNSKIVLVAPNTVWISSSDFGISKKIESTVGMHSDTLFTKTLDLLFNKIWKESKLL